ncbi:MAG: hypothetical protein HN578_06215 [Rhodospirillales bacterium]|jgi:hypothetical protein|nr:hypothetical protein [Rhodospirillales bacterium]
MIYRFFIAIFVAGLVFVPTDFSHAAEAKLGKITPNGPFRLWTAVNKGLVEYAFVKGGSALKANVAALTAVPTTGKKPGHVLAQGAEFRAALDNGRAKYNLAPSKKYRDPKGRAVTPAVVFLNAGYMLDGLVRLIEAQPNVKDFHVGIIYVVPKFSGKSPSNVFALAELATRRMALIAEN